MPNAMQPLPSESWPRLPLDSWTDTYETLHLWLQIVGKIRMTLSPPLNHWWHSTLYVTPRGLTTANVPSGQRLFQMTMDFLSHELIVQTSDGESRTLELRPRTVADFHEELMTLLHDLDIHARFGLLPQELANPIRFDLDTRHASYDRERIRDFWKILCQAERLLSKFRSGFLGKCSPVHFFWGSFDLAVTRFSGRRAPPHPGGIPNMADWVTREAYSHEVSSCGFWFGRGAHEALFYSYAYPAPPEFKERHIRPWEAMFDATLKEFILPYEAVRGASDPDAMVLEFLRETYEAAAELGAWDRGALEGPTWEGAEPRRAPDLGRNVEIIA